MRENFPLCFRITLKRDIESLKESKERLKGKYVIIVFRKNSLPHSRLLVVVSSRIGNAVMRNRCKRIIREVFRKKMKGIVGYDFMIIARSLIKGSKYSEIESEILELIKSTI